MSEGVRVFYMFQTHSGKEKTKERQGGVVDVKVTDYRIGYM